jgi:energy-coupling factor transporter ATP-binding protein EcfA2
MERHTLSSIQYTNFKAFSSYSVALQHVNVLVGPNNSGKSTVIGSLRVLAAGIRHARHRSPQRVDGPQGVMLGYALPVGDLPISVENARTDYNEKPAEIAFRLTNGTRITFFFPVSGGCNMIVDPRGPPVRTPAGFRSAVPLSIGVVPVLGPLEHDEPLLTPETVRRHVATHRASRHFRNFWHHFPEDFDSFARLISDSWPGMQVRRPETQMGFPTTLHMFCSEGRIDRELYWVGFGFQVWCQLLTHIVRSRNDTILVVDEPDIYLHPDLQVRLLNILRDSGPDLVLATHSTEMIADSDPDEIVTIGARQGRSAQRLRDAKGVQAAMTQLGSVHNLSLTRLAKSGRVIAVEGADFGLLRRFARKLHLKGLAGFADVSVLPLGGFANWRDASAIANGLRQLGAELKIGVVLDRDYRCAEEIRTVEMALAKSVHLVHVFCKKELENYLLVPAALDRALVRAVKERARRFGNTTVPTAACAAILDAITDELKAEVLGQYGARHHDFHSKQGIDKATSFAVTLQPLQLAWQSPSARLGLVPGKQVLARLNSALQKQFSVSLTTSAIVDALSADDIPDELRQLLVRLESFVST